MHAAYALLASLQATTPEQLFVTVQHIGKSTTHAGLASRQAAVHLVGWRDACLKQAAAAPQDTAGQDRVQEAA